MNRTLEILAALNTVPYNPQMTIDALKRFTSIDRAYSLLNSRKRSYNLEKHTLMVCAMFEKYFSSVSFPKAFGISPFRVLLCLHDIGKPNSLLANEKPLQNQYTEKMIEEIAEYLPITLAEYKVMTALLSDDPLGLYIREKVNADEARSKINLMVSKSFISKSDFVKLIFIYYQVDSTAYTREGYIGDISEFNEKPKLERVFLKNQYGELVFSDVKERLLFSDIVENRIALLCKSIEVE